MNLKLKPRKQPRQARSRAMVDAILDAAARVLERDGYAGASTNAVAEAAGVSVGSLYQYFPNKDALVAALHERHARHVHGLISVILAEPRSRSLEQTLREMIHAGVEAHRVQPQLHRVLESEVPHLDRLDEQEETGDAIREIIAALVRNHPREVKVKNLDLAAFVVHEIIHALVHAAVIDPPPGLDGAAIERETVRAVHAYLTSAPAAAVRRRSRLA